MGGVTLVEMTKEAADIAFTLIAANHSRLITRLNFLFRIPPHRPYF